MAKVSIFSSNFGKSGTIPLDVKPTTCFGVQIGDLINNTNKRNTGVIVTNFDIKKAENISVTPTLGTQLFLYVGGESAWEIAIQGVLLQGCTKGDKHGFNEVLAWYNKKNVKETGKPIDLTLNGVVYKGYLYRFQIQSEYKFTNCFSFTATFVGVIKAPKAGEKP